MAMSRVRPFGGPSSSPLGTSSAPYSGTRWPGCRRGGAGPERTPPNTRDAAQVRCGRPGLLLLALPFRQDDNVVGKHGLGIRVACPEAHGHREDQTAEDGWAVHGPDSFQDRIEGGILQSFERQILDHQPRPGKVSPVTDAPWRTRSASSSL